MHICYVDEAGCTGNLPSPKSPIQPCFVIAGIIIDQSALQLLTTDFLRLKRQFYPNALPPTAPYLEWIRHELKGAEIRRSIRGNSRRKRRHALGLLDKFVDLMRRHHVTLVGRLWVKGIGATFNGTSVYTSSMQSICKDFQQFLTEAQS
ncbi:MAG: DUF3800 domain-containing protein, partial [Phototrophicales bacterium]